MVGILKTTVEAAGGEPIPLVIVGGFLSAPSPAMWGNFEEHLNDLDEGAHAGKCPKSPQRRRVIFASVGPVSSLHDRACELYYALRGGPVDYGAKHAHENRHGRFGRVHAQGLYPEWSRQKPLHFLGHSMGGPTIIKLQWLISTGFFGKDDHPDMCLSIAGLSAPFRGSQAVYMLGERPDSAPAIRQLSIGSALSRVVHILSYIAPFLPHAFDLHTESRSLSYDKTSFSSLLRQLWHSDWAEERDATPYDVTFAAADEREAMFEGFVHPGTFYRSYTASMTTRKAGNDGHHSPGLKNLLFAPHLYMLSASIGTFDFSQVRPAPDCITPSSSVSSDVESPTGECDTRTTQSEDLGGSDALWANDGVVPLFSQWHPFPCRLTYCEHYSDCIDEAACAVRIEPGRWHVQHFEDATHASLAPIWYGSQRQRVFWKGLGQWMRDVEKTLM